MLMKKLVLVLAAVSAMSGLSSCNGQTKVISSVNVKLSENLEIVTVTMNFAPNIQMAYQGNYDILSYGSVFVNPYTANVEPFQAGFELNTAIVNDQNYVHLTPTSVLPNGMNIGLPNPVVEVKKATPINSQFDLFAYVDVLQANWLGAAAMFNSVDPKFFPPGLSVSQVFKRDNSGVPTLEGYAYGPVLDDAGKMVHAPGVAVFANVKALISGMAGGTTISLKPTSTKIELIK